jgi:hypothetical protein
VNAAATAPVEDMVRRIHDVAGGLLSLDRQMVGRLMRTVVPDILYLEYKSLYLEVKASGAAVAGRAARRDASPHHGRVALLRDRRQDGGSPCGRLAEDGSPHHAARRDALPHQTKRQRGRRGSGLKGSRTERMVEQLADFKAWLRDNPVNERNAARTVGARASAYWRLHEKTMARDAKRTGEKRGFSSAKTLASAYRNS